MLLAKQGRDEDARRALEQALTLNPNLVVARAACNYLHEHRVQRLSSTAVAPSPP
jgi:hypothetical protein